MLVGDGAPTTTLLTGFLLTSLGTKPDDQLVAVPQLEFPPASDHVEFVWPSAAGIPSDATTATLRAETDLRGNTFNWDMHFPSFKTPDPTPLRVGTLGWMSITDSQLRIRMQ